MPELFLPFSKTARPIELKAVGIKQAHGYDAYDAVDPDDLARRMGATIVPAAWYEGLDPGLRDDLLGQCATAWSAGSIVVKERTHILLNPLHSEARRSASLAEELVHVGLGHPASALQEVAGVPMRTCRQDVESEAYAVAIALLLPYRSVFHHLNAGGPIDELPAIVPVSLEARRYRVKVSGLWRLAQARARERVVST